jgi:hypothetical protein
MQEEDDEEAIPHQQVGGLEVAEVLQQTVMVSMEQIILGEVVVGVRITVTIMVVREEMVALA